MQKIHCLCACVCACCVSVWEPLFVGLFPFPLTFCVWFPAFLVRRLKLFPPIQISLSRSLSLSVWQQQISFCRHLNANCKQIDAFGATFKFSTISPRKQATTTTWISSSTNKWKWQSKLKMWPRLKRFHVYLNLIFEKLHIYSFALDLNDCSIINMVD